MKIKEVIEGFAVVLAIVTFCFLLIATFVWISTKECEAAPAWPVKKPLYHVSAVTTEKEHIACLAHRNLTLTESVQFILDKKGTLSMTLSGVTFDLTGSDNGLVQIDDEDPKAVFVKYETDWQTSVDLSTPTSDDLRQWKKGSMLTLFVNGFKYSFDLRGTASLAAELSACNASGQANVNRQRISEAKQARTRTAT